MANLNLNLQDEYDRPIVFSDSSSIMAVMKTDLESIHENLLTRSAEKGRPAILAIDGRCGAGKSTLGAELASKWGANLFHMDDFYLQPHQRTPERLAEPGGNVDRERFLEEVLLPLRTGKPVIYRRFDCGSFTFEEGQIVSPKPVAIVEGSYACHPLLRNYYDLRIFLDIDPQTQAERILKRNGPEVLERFKSIWIPLEETYFGECRVRECCDFILNLSL